MTTNSPRTPRKPRKGDEREARLTAFDHKGRTLGASGEYTTETREGVPGDRVRVLVTKRRRDRLRGRVLEVLEPGAERVEPRCRHAASCGGCSFQAFAYAAQLGEKRRFVQEALAGEGLADAVRVAPVVGCDEPWRYRNKMEYSFANRRWIEPGEPEDVEADFALGLHAPGRFDKVLDVRECPILFAEGEPILASARELALEQGLEPWDVREHIGLLRFLVLRHGARSGEVMVYLLVSRREPERVDPYVHALIARHPEITTLVLGVTARHAEVAVGEQDFVLHGPGTIREELCGLSFRVSPTSFFQTNTAQAERLFDIVREEARLTGNDLVLDLYSGTGTISLLLAGSAGRVRGYEQVPSAVRDAERAARENGIANVEFVPGDVLETLRAERGSGAFAVPDLVVLDPPRAGLHPRVPTEVLALRPRRIVFVSCNARTAARDLARFVADGYAIESARPLDLFPHTPHVECVFALTRQEDAP